HHAPDAQLHDISVPLQNVRITHRSFCSSISIEQTTSSLPTASSRIKNTRSFVQKRFDIMIEDQVDNSRDTRRRGRDPLRIFMTPEERMKRVHRKPLAVLMTPGERAKIESNAA